jgi:GNAT superfamily N-acetyltransferase
MIISIVNITPHHAPELEHLQEVCFPTLGADELMQQEHFLKHCEVFPEGSFVALSEAKVVGLGSGFYLDFDFSHTDHTFREVIAQGYYTNHDPNGDYYYGADISVHPDFRGQGIGRLLYDARKNLVIEDNRKGIVAGGVLPGYPQYRSQMNPTLYVEKVVTGEIFDPTLSMQLRNGFEVRGMLENYIEDTNSDNWAALIFWPNPEYQESK